MQKEVENIVHANTGKGRHLLRTGVPGLDVILNGGLTPDRLYLLEGTPGAGKTTLALQFLRAGVDAGETALYVTLSESEEELHAVADSHGWDNEGINTLEVVPTEDHLDPDSQYTVFHPSDVELATAFRKILDEVERLNASRVIIDSLSELRLLAEGPLQFRRQLLALKRFFGGRKCTVLVLDDQLFDMQIQSIAHGVIRLEVMKANYGAHRRRLQVMKYRGMSYSSGFHDYTIVKRRPDGVPAPGRRRTRGAPSSIDPLESGVPELDRLLGGGLERGTSTLILGAAGSGKSTLALQFCVCGVRARRARGDLHLRREHGDAHRRGRGPGHRPRRPSSSPGHAADPPDRSRRALAGRVRPPRRGRGRGRRHGDQHRQPERLPARDARGELPAAATPRAAHLARARRAWPRCWCASSRA